MSLVTENTLEKGLLGLLQAETKLLTTALILRIYINFVVRGSSSGKLHESKVSCEDLAIFYCTPLAKTSTIVCKNILGLALWEIIQTRITAMG